MVASEFHNMIGRNANSEPSPVSAHGSTRPCDANENNVNIAMFWNVEGNGNPRQSQSRLHSKSEDSSTKVANEEVNIVPFDQTKYFEGKTTTQEDFQAENETNEGMTLDDEFGFNDIDIVPYDQSC
jgi:hypothetical protein